MIQPGHRGPQGPAASRAIYTLWRALSIHGRGRPGVRALSAFSRTRKGDV